MFFPPPEKQPKPQGKGHIDFQLLHMLGCKVCPLAHLDNRCPNMDPSGAKRPLVYMIGEAPGKDEDDEGLQFVGKSGALLRRRLEKEYPELEDRFRWNNTVRTRPWEWKTFRNKRGHLSEREVNRTPTQVEIECCRPSIIQDIERSKPKAVFGFGNVPLQMLTGFTGISAWRGRRMPVKIGSHVCWYYPMLHPAGLLRQGMRGRRDKFQRPMFQDPVPVDGRIPSEQERMFVFDLRRALDEIEGLHDAEILSPWEALSNITIITEFTNSSLDLIESTLSRYSKEPVVGIDYETTAIRPYTKNSRVLSAAVGTENEALAFPFDHSSAEWSPKQRKRLDRIWINFLETCKAIKTVHNLQFELEWTGHRFGTHLIRTGKWEDSLIQANTLDERSFGTKPGPLSLEFLMLQYFGINVKKLANVDRGRLDQIPLPNVLEYNGLDAKSHCMLYKQQVMKIAVEGLEKAHGYMLRRIPAIALSQLKGMPVSQKIAKELDRKYAKRHDDAMAAIKEHKYAKEFRRKFGEDFKPHSTDHVLKMFGKHFLNREEIHVEVKAKERARALEKENLREDDKDLGDTKETARKAILKTIPGDMPKLIIAARESRHRRSSYIAKMLVDHEKTNIYPDGLLHPNFNPWKARTGRMAADNPPVQQWPKRDSEAREVRKPVAAEKGNTIIAVDYGQIEARVIAMYTKDPRFVKALWEDYDIHQEWAERVARRIPSRIGGKDNLKDKAIMKAFRTDIKNQWTFPLVFGATAASVAEYLGLLDDLNKVEKLIKEFWNEFEGIHDWQKGQMRFYKEHGYVETFTGRRRRGPLSPNKVYNSPIQGVTAEIVMDAFCRLSETDDPVLQAELNIHDDLTFLRVPEKKVDYYLEKIIDMMIQPPFEFINVPISLEASIGPNWLEMEEVGVFSSHKWDPKYHKIGGRSKFKLAT